MPTNEARIKGRLDMNASSVGTELGKASAVAAAFGAKMRGIGKGLAGVFTFGAATAIAKNLIGTADSIQDMAEAYNMGTDSLQAFQAMARTTKGGIEGLDGISKKLVESQAKAMEGSDSEAEAFSKLGISIADVTGPTDVLMKKIADGYAKTGNLSAVMTLLGKQTVGTSAFLKELATTGLQEAIDKQKEFGQVIQDDGIDKLAAMDDKIASVSAKIKATLVNDTLPILELASGTLGGLISGKSLAESIALSEEVMREDEARRRQGREQTQREREELAKKGAMSGAESKIRELERIVSVAAPQSIGSELVRIGARGGIAGGESPEAKLAKQQLAELKAIKDNTSGISPETGTFKE